MGGSYAGADADQGCQGPFVECRWAFVLPDLGGGVEGVGVLGGGLESHFDDVLQRLSAKSMDRAAFRETYQRVGLRGDKG